VELWIGCIVDLIIISQFLKGLRHTEGTDLYLQTVGCVPNDGWSSLSVSLKRFHR